MKKLFFILLLAFVALASNSQAQEKNLPVTGDTVIAETLDFEVSYSNWFTGATNYSGIAGYIFYIDNIADSCEHVYLQGSYDASNYVVVDSLTLTGTDSTYVLYDAPPVYLNYKITAKAATGDTVLFKNIRYFQKEE